jgi:hypothetical protein
LKIASVPGEVFIDTAVDDFMLSSENPLHVGVTGAVPGRAALRVTADSTTFLKDVIMQAGLTSPGIQVDSMSVRPDTPHLRIRGPQTSYGRTYLDDVGVKGDDLTAGTVAADTVTAFSSIVGTTTVGGVLVSAYGSGSTLKLQAARALASPAAPPPVDPSLTDPDQIQLAMAERDVAMAQARLEAHAINESAISLGASLDARQVIVETLTHPTGADHLTHQGVAKFTDQVVFEKGIRLGGEVTHGGSSLSVIDGNGAPGSVTLQGLDLGGASLIAGQAMGAWDVVDVVQRDAVRGDVSGVFRAGALCVSATGAQDAALVNAGGGVVAVSGGNGSLSTPCAFTAASLSVGATTIRPSVDDRALDVSHPIQVPSARVGAYTLTPELDCLTLSGALKCDGVRVNDVTLTKHAPTPDEIAIGSSGSGVDLSDKLHVQTVRLKTAADVWVELTADSLTGAVALQNMDGQVVTLHPSHSALSVKPAALRLVHDTGHVELRGTPGLLALDVNQLAFASGQRMLQEGGGKVVFNGSWSVNTDTFKLEMAAGADVLHTNARALQLDLGVTLRSKGAGRVHIDGGNASISSESELALEAQNAIILRLCDQQASWKEYAFTSKADGALLLNGHDLDVIPKDIMLSTTADSGIGNGPWWRMSPSRIEVRYSHLSRTPTVRPRLQQLRFPDSVARTYVEGGVEHVPIVTLGFYGFGVDVLLPSPRVLRRVGMYADSFGQGDQLPTSWRVFGSDGGSENWQELGRAGFAQTIETTGNPQAYDCFRVLIGSLSSGSSIRSQDLALFVAAEARDAPTQHSFTGSHMVVPAPGHGIVADFEVGTLVSIAGGGVLDSVDRGGFKARGGVSAIRVDSALPMVTKTIRPHDKAIFGVVSGVVVNRWCMEGRDVRLRVNGIGEGAVWVTDEGGALEIGDLLCSSSTPGYAMKQPDDLVRSYTLGRITMACNFAMGATVPSHVLVLDEHGDVAWHVQSVEAAYACRVLGSGGHAAFLSCIFTCS